MSKLSASHVATSEEALEVLRDAHILLVGKKSEASVVLWRHIYRKLDGLVVLGPLAKVLSGSGEAKVVLERLCNCEPCGWVGVHESLDEILGFVRNRLPLGRWQAQTDAAGLFGHFELGKTSYQHHV